MGILKAPASDIQPAEIIDAMRIETAIINHCIANYHAFMDETTSDNCTFSIEEAIQQHYEWEGGPSQPEYAVISVARELPAIHIVVRYFTDAEKDGRDDDEEFEYTEYPNEEAARKALGTSHDS